MGCSKRMARCNDDAENALRGQHVNYAFIRAYTQHRQKGSGSGDWSMTADQLRSEDTKPSLHFDGVVSNLLSTAA
jgi:hypothetical protein